MKIRLTLVALLLAVLTPALPSYAAKIPHCLTFSDPKGDTSPAPDPSLDITSVTWKTTAKAIVGTVTVAQYASHPLLSVENRFDLNFTVNGIDVVMFWKNGPARSVEANGFYQQGLRVDNVVVDGIVDGGWSGNTLTMSVRYSALKIDLGHSVVGKKFTNLSALARAAYGYNDANETFDTATTKSSFNAGGVCK